MQIRNNSYFVVRSIAEFTHILHTFAWWLTCSNAIRTQQSDDDDSNEDSINITLFYPCRCRARCIRPYLLRRLFDFTCRPATAVAALCDTQKSTVYSSQFNSVLSIRVFSTHARNGICFRFTCTTFSIMWTLPNSISVKVNTCKCS